MKSLKDTLNEAWGANYGVKYEGAIRGVNKDFKMPVNQFIKEVKNVIKWAKKFYNWEEVNEPWINGREIKFSEVVKSICDELIDATEYAEDVIDADFLADFDFYMEQSFNENDHLGKIASLSNYKQALCVFEYAWEYAQSRTQNPLFGYDINGSIVK